LEKRFRKRAAAIATLCLSDQQLDFIQGNSLEDIGTGIEEFYRVVEIKERLRIRRILRGTRMRPGESIESHIDKVCRIIDNLRDLGDVLNDEERGMVLLESVVVNSVCIASLVDMPITWDNAVSAVLHVRGHAGAGGERAGRDGFEGEQASLRRLTVKGDSGVKNIQREERVSGVRVPPGFELRANVTARSCGTLAAKAKPTAVGMEGNHSSQLINDREVVDEYETLQDMVKMWTHWPKGDEVRKGESIRSTNEMPKSVGFSQGEQCKPEQE
jgi:hypothetical protein